MKFGRDLHNHQVPAWADAYVHYDRLKLLARSGSDKDFTEAIGHEENRINRFCGLQSGSIQCRIADLEKHYGLSLASAVASQDSMVVTTRLLTQVAIVELRDLQASLEEIQTAVVQLDGYRRVNIEAINRIKSKRRRHSTGANENLVPGDATAAAAARAWDSSLLSAVNCFQVAVSTALTGGNKDGFVPTSPTNRPVSLVSEQLIRVRDLDISDTAHRAIIANDLVALEEALQNYHDKDNKQTALPMRALLKLAVLYSSFGCLDFLAHVSDPSSPGTKTHGSEEADILHQLIIHLGRHESSSTTVDQDGRVQKLLNSLPPGQRCMVSSTDILGNLPLHYAAEYGLAATCAEIISSMISWGWSASRRREEAHRCNAVGETPLDIAVRRGHKAAVKVLLTEVLLDYEDAEPESGTQQLLGRLLLGMVRAGFDEFLSIFLPRVGQSILNYRNDDGQTATYIAARYGRISAVRALLLAGADPNLAETVRGWTPLMISAIQGHQDVLQYLVQDANASRDTRDYDRGWTALDHAAYKGYPAMMKMLRPSTDPLTDGLTRIDVKSDNRAAPFSDNDRPIPPRASHPQSYIFVHPGTLDVYDNVAAVDISLYRAEVAPAVIPDSTLFLEISSLDPSHTRKVPAWFSQLPILEDWSNRSWGFPTDEPSGANVVFRLFSSLTASDTDNGVIGTAVALLSSLRLILGPGRESLIRHHTIPLLGPRGNLVGTVTFTFMVARACPGSLCKPPPTAAQRLGHPASTLISAHRGLGQNGTRYADLQIGENTLPSLMSSLDVGADLVEFDVQVTKDLVPVIYHDFLLSETGADVGVHAVTFQQFMAISDAQVGDGSEMSVNPRLPWDEAARPRPVQRRRAASLHATRDAASKALIDRMKPTFDYSLNGFKPNIRTKHIHAPFVTLKELLLKLPPNVAFDVELKYPMLSEANDFTMDLYGIEVNTYVDCILNVLYEFGGNRRIVLTSFSPEVCMALAMKQQTYPILFLNESCTARWPTHDIRAISVQTAIHFARGLGIEGVVMVSDPFVASPRLVRKVQDSGLICWSFGNMNDDPDNALIQAKAGLDVIIVNHVRRIAEALTKDASP